MKAVLTIAGSDCSGGAGIQADLKTFLMHRVYGMSAITALTAQNTTGVYGVAETEPTVLASQLDCVFQDIFPDAVKIGMMPSVQAVQVTAQKLRQYRPAYIVLDPVMVSTSGRWLMSTQAVAAIQQELFPLAEVLTPNLPEAGSADRTSDHQPCGDGSSGGGAVPALWLRHPAQGWTSDGGCGRSAVAEGTRAVASRAESGKSKRPRYRLHLVQRHRSQPGKRSGAVPSGERGESLSDGGAERWPELGSGSGPHGSHLGGNGSLVK